MASTRTKITVESGSKFIGLTFLYMFLALIITAGVALGLSQLFQTVFPLESLDGTQFDSQNIIGYFVLLIVAAIGIGIVAIWFRIAAFKAKRSISLWIPYVLNAVFMGILMSSFTMFTDQATLIIALAITTLMFGSMAAFGFVLKRVNFIVTVILGLSVGLMFFFFGGLIFNLLFPEIALMNYTLVAGICFVLSALVTIVDVFRLRKIAETGDTTPNLALYCAFDIYLDFVVMFIRILRIVAMTRNRN